MTKRTVAYATLIGAILLFLPVLPVRAQGVLELHQPGTDIGHPVPRPEPIPPVPMPRPRPVPGPILPAQLTKLDVEVEIDGQVARTELDQTFKNPNSMRLEGTYLFPLPPNAAIKDLSLYIDGKPVKAEVVEADKARKIYEDIVRRMRDPALLEYIGRDLVKLRIFPIEPHQVRRVRFTYSQVLKRDFGMTEYAYPLAPRGRSAEPIGQITLTGSIRSDVPITTIYSPTHKIEFNRKGDTKVTFGFEAEDHCPAADLKIYYAVSQNDIGAGLLTYREEGEPGYFMLTIAPRNEIKSDKVMQKDLTFVLDTSGSMSGEKIEQAKKAFEFCLNALREDDRFNIIRFSTETERFSDALVHASPEKVKEAIEFVRDFTATGGTAINDALLEAVKRSGGQDRPHLIVFLTDGKPTVGETDEDAIVKNVTKANEDSARIFVFGIGTSVNTHLLDKISGGNGGVSDYVTPDEEIELKVSNFFAKVSEPVLTDVSLDFGAINVSKFYPTDMPDLFRGSQVMLIGRYKGSGETTVTLSGRASVEKRVFEYEVEFPKESDAADFLPRLWAIRRVGHLVDEIRKHGEDDELKDEIVRLGKKYGIATPYTSMLVLEDEGRVPVERFGRFDVHENFSRGVRAGGSGISPSVAPELFDVSSAPVATDALQAKSGEASVYAAEQTRDMKESTLVTAQYDAAENVKHVGSRTFYLKNRVWTDSEYDGKAKTIDVEYGSDAYFDLLSKGGDIGTYLALGTQVIFQFDDTWYRIIDSGE